MNSPLMAMVSKTDKRYIRDLPEALVMNVYIDYLFAEFIYKYNFYFRYEKHNKMVPLKDIKFRRFLRQFI
jgi:hypothetical protein